MFFKFLFFLSILSLLIDENLTSSSEKKKIDESLIKLNIMKCLISMCYYCVYLVISLHMKAKLMKGMHLNRALVSITALDFEKLKM